MGKDMEWDGIEYGMDGKGYGMRWERIWKKMGKDMDWDGKEHGMRKERLCTYNELGYKLGVTHFILK